MATQRDVAAHYLAMSASEIKAQQAQKYEEAVVRHIVSKLRFGNDVVAQILAAGGGSFTCGAFVEITLPDFLLAAYRLKHNPALDALLDKRFERSTLFQHYGQAFYDIEDLAECMCPRMLVFPWRGHSRFMVLHNSINGACHRGRYYRVDGVKYYIEYLDDILDELGPAIKW